MAIKYELTKHNNKNCIAVYFGYNHELNKKIQQVPGAKWSRALKAWTIPDTSYNRSKCKLTSAAADEQNNKKPINAGKSVYKNISTKNKEQLQKFLHQLQLKAYSPSTIRTYRNEFAQLLQMLGEFPVQNLKPQHVQRYLLYCIKKGISEHAIHSRMNALKFYYEQVLHREKFFFDIPRPKRPLQLPKILNEIELKRMFAAVTNLKHKAILFIAYSAGLRVSETVNLRLQDIDSKRMQIFIQKAKGKKDRVVPLSVLVLDVLRQYIKLQNPRPNYYLFTSSDGKEAYSERSAQKIFQQAKQLVGIKKDISFHSLRHSFATHLLEKGIDVKYIKDLLGHFDIRTTERYLHVSKEKLINITSPLDSLYEEEKHELRITDTNYKKKQIEKH